MSLAERGLDIKQWGGSWISMVPAALLKAEQSPRSENRDPSRGITTADKRRGRAKHSAVFTSPSGTKICGLFRWVQDNGTGWNIAREGTKIWRYTSGGETDITGAAVLTADALTRFTAFDSLLVIASGGTPLKWSGSGNVATLGGSPPADLATVVTAGRRVWGARANSSTIAYCAVGNVEDWTTADDAGTLQVNESDGDTIKALEAADDFLYVFKRQRVYAIRGVDSIDTLSGFDVPIFHEGAVNVNAAVAIAHYVFFASDNGIYMINGAEVSEVSAGIQDVYDAISSKSTICLGRLKTRQLWVGYDGDGDGVNDTALVLDFRLGRWDKYTGIPARVFASLEDGKLIFGSPSQVLAFEADTGTNDDGTAITMLRETPDIYNPHWHRDKSFKAFWLLAEKTGNYNVTVKVCFDGDTGSYTTLSSTFNVSGTGLVYARYALPARRAKFARFQISEGGSSSTIKVLGYAVEMDEHEGVR